MFTIEQVRKTFTDFAPRYDATHAWRLLKRREARLALGVQPGNRLIEIACGTGLNFPHLHQLIGDRGSLIGVDLSPAMLDIARRQVARHRWKNVEVREADAAQLPFADASSDKAFCAFALNIIPEYERAIAEVRRVLVPGGAACGARDAEHGYEFLVRLAGPHGASADGGMCGGYVASLTRGYPGCVRRSPVAPVPGGDGLHCGGDKTGIRIRLRNTASPVLVGETQ